MDPREFLDSLDDATLIGLGNKACDELAANSILAVAGVPGAAEEAILAYRGVNLIHDEEIRRGLVGTARNLFDRANGIALRISGEPIMTRDQYERVYFGADEDQPLN